MKNFMRVATVSCLPAMLFLTGCTSKRPIRDNVKPIPILLPEKEVVNEEIKEVVVKPVETVKEEVKEEIKEEVKPTVVVKEKEEAKPTESYGKPSAGKGIIFKGSPNRKQVALTFDDGPDTKNTPKIMNILDKHGVPGTFFYTGMYIKRHPNVVRDTARRGHEVAVHSLTHPNFKKISHDEFKRQIHEPIKAVESLIPNKVRYFRPPYGAIKPSQVSYLSGKGIYTVNWSVDSQDWRSNYSSERSKNEILNGLHNGAIVLMHSASFNGWKSAGYLDSLIREIKSRGYEIVSLDEILR